ncbi:MAG: hypothetical protein WC976_06850 [Caldisericia bacterium]
MKKKFVAISKNGKFLIFASDENGELDVTETDSVYEATLLEQDKKFKCFDQKELEKAAAEYFVAPIKWAEVSVTILLTEK